MDDILARVQSWMERGEAVALATIVEVERKAPRGPGAAMAVSARREIAGSLSGGCVEPALVEEAGSVLDRGEPRLVSFGISDDQALGVGLSCGGAQHVLLGREGPRPGHPPEVGPGGGREQGRRAGYVFCGRRRCQRDVGC